MKKIMIHSLFVFFIAITLLILRSYRFWPFATGSNTPAFLGTTFGMSLPEVQRTLKKRGVQLIDGETFKKDHPELYNDSDFVVGALYMKSISSQVEDTSKVVYWYMPPIDMFESSVIAEFDFTENKLTDVDIEFYPFDKLSNDNTTATLDTQPVIDMINNSLVTKYKFVKKESGKYADAFYYEGRSSSLEFITNLSDKTKPEISLDISYAPPINKRDQEIKTREALAF